MPWRCGKVVVIAQTSLHVCKKHAITITQIEKKLWSLDLSPLFRSVLSEYLSIHLPFLTAYSSLSSLLLPSLLYCINNARHHVISLSFIMSYYHAMTCHHVMPNQMKSSHIMPCHIISYHVMSCQYHGCIEPTSCSFHLRWFRCASFVD